METDREEIYENLIPWVKNLKFVLFRKTNFLKN